MSLVEGIEYALEFGDIIVVIFLVLPFFWILIGTSTSGSSFTFNPIAFASVQNNLLDRFGGVRPLMSDLRFLQNRVLNVSEIHIPWTDWPLNRFGFLPSVPYATCAWIPTNSTNVNPLQAIYPVENQSSVGPSFSNPALQCIMASSAQLTKSLCILPANPTTAYFQALGIFAPVTLMSMPVIYIFFKLPLRLFVHRKLWILASMLIILLTLFASALAEIVYLQNSVQLMPVYGTSSITYLVWPVLNVFCLTFLMFCVVMEFIAEYWVFDAMSKGESSKGENQLNLPDWVKRHEGDGPPIVWYDLLRSSVSFVSLLAMSLLAISLFLQNLSAGSIIVSTNDINAMQPFVMSSDFVSSNANPPGNPQWRTRSAMSWETTTRLGVQTSYNCFPLLRNPNVNLSYAQAAPLVIDNFITSSNITITPGNTFVQPVRSIGHVRIWRVISNQGIGDVVLSQGNLMCSGKCTVDYYARMADSFPSFIFPPWRLMALLYAGESGNMTYNVLYDVAGTTPSIAYTNASGSFGGPFTPPGVASIPFERTNDNNRFLKYPSSGTDFYFYPNVTYYGLYRYNNYTDERGKSYSFYSASSFCKDTYNMFNCQNCNNSNSASVDPNGDYTFLTMSNRVNLPMTLFRVQLVPNAPLKSDVCVEDGGSAGCRAVARPNVQVDLADLLLQGRLYGDFQTPNGQYGCNNQSELDVFQISLNEGGCVAWFSAPPGRNVEDIRSDPDIFRKMVCSEAPADFSNSNPSSFMDFVWVFLLPQPFLYLISLYLRLRWTFLPWFILRLVIVGLSLLGGVLIFVNMWLNTRVLTEFWSSLAVTLEAFLTLFEFFIEYFELREASKHAAHLAHIRLNPYLQSNRDEPAATATATTTTTTE